MCTHTCVRTYIHTYIHTVHDIHGDMSHVYYFIFKKKYIKL